MSNSPPRKKTKVKTTSESVSGDQQSQERSSDATVQDFMFKAPPSAAPRRKKVSKNSDQNSLGSSDGNHSESNGRYDMVVDTQSSLIPEPTTSNGNDNDRPRKTTLLGSPADNDSDSSESDSDSIVSISSFRMPLPNWKRKKGYSDAAFRSQIDDFLLKKLPPPGSILKAEHNRALDELSEIMDKIPKQLDHMIDKLIIDFMDVTNLSTPAVRVKDPRLTPSASKPRKKRVTKRVTNVFSRKSVVSQTFQGDQNLMFDDLIRPHIEEPILEFPRTTDEEFQEGLRTLDAMGSGAVEVPNLPANNSDFGMSRLHIDNSMAPPLFPEAFEDSVMTNNIATRQSPSHMRAEIVDELVIPNLGLNDVEMPTVAGDLNLDTANISTAQQTSTENAETLLQKVNKEQRKKSNQRKNIFRRSTVLSANLLDSFEAKALEDREILYRSPPVFRQIVDLISVDSFDFSFITEEIYRTLHGPLLTNDAINSNPIFRSENCNHLDSNVPVNNAEDVNAILPLNDVILPPNDAVLPPNDAVLPPNYDVPLVSTHDGISPPDPPGLNVPLQSENMAVDSATFARDSNSIPVNSTKKTSDVMSVLRQKDSTKTPSSRPIRSITIDFDSMSFEEIVEQIRMSRNDRINSIRRMSTPTQLPLNSTLDEDIFSRNNPFEYTSNTENDQLLEEIDGALRTKDVITFDELRPVEFTDRLNAAFTFRTLLNLWAGKKVSIQQTGSSPQDIVISKE